MTQRWIHEGDAFPNGFYIKSGALYDPKDYYETKREIKSSRDGLVEQVHWNYDLIPYARPSIPWVAFGWHGKYFRIYIRFVNKPDKVKVYWGILRRPKKHET